VADIDVAPSPKENPMDTKLNPLTIDMNNNGKPDHQEIAREQLRAAAAEPEFIQRLAREVVGELKRHPHTLFSRAVSKVKAAGAWLGI
jgi:hypothetical protein